eukprot:351076-Chlamydomonas_euryale.AAC.3
MRAEIDRPGAPSTRAGAPGAVGSPRRPGLQKRHHTRAAFAPPLLRPSHGRRARRNALTTALDRIAANLSSHRAK